MSTAHRIQRLQRNHPRQFSPQTAKAATRHQQIPATEVGRRVEEKVAAGEIKECFESFQLKYDIDRSSPWWKKLYFWCLYLPFARFSFFKVGIVPMDHVRCVHCRTAAQENRQLGWLERQTVWAEEWEALRDAERYPFGGVQRLPFNIKEKEETCSPLSQFPNSKVRERYERYANKSVSVPESSLERLSRKLTETDPLVNRFRTKPT